MLSVNPKIRQCANALHAGAVIAYPTEAVWGLGCDPDNAQALMRVLELKRRPWAKGLILVASEMAQFEFLLQGLGANERQQLHATWPGHTTWLVPHHGRVSPLIHGTHDSVALRVSAHPVVRALCDAFGGPIVSTSANPQSLPPARNVVSARRFFGDQVLYAPGRVGGAAQPSRIRDLRTNAVIR